MPLLRRVALATALMSALRAVAAPPVVAAGPILSGLAKPAAVTTLKPGVVQYRYRIVVNDDGVIRKQTMYKIAWSYPSTRVSLHSALLGSYASTGWIHNNPISSWASWS